MSTFYSQYPPSASGSNPSIGTPGAPAPTSATEIAGVDSAGNLIPVSVDPAGIVNVNVASSTLPAGGSTAALQTAGNNILAGILLDQTNGTQITQISGTVPLPTGAATAANQTTALSRLSGSLVPTAYNEIDLTYITSGNGTGQVGTAVYKLAAATVATLTLTYDASNRLSTVVKS